MASNCDWLENGRHQMFETVQGAETVEAQWNADMLS